MENPAMVKTFKYHSVQQPIFNVMETSLHYSSFAQNHQLIRDPSFPPYLMPAPEEPIAASSGDDIEESEISIFEAHEYFSQGNDPRESSKVSPALNTANSVADASEVSRRPSSASSVDGYVRNYRIRSFHANTPTASSKASWNIHTRLLSNAPDLITVSLRNDPADQEKKKAESVATRWFLGRRCPCSGNKSVQVEENSTTSADSENKNSKRQIIKHLSGEKTAQKIPANKSQKNSFTSSHMADRQDQRAIPNPRRLSLQNYFPTNTALQHYHHHQLGSFADKTGTFSFPILNPSSPVKLVMKKPLPPFEDPPRESLEVFRPSENSVSRKSSLELPQRLFASGKFPELGSPISGVTATDDDAASDASSDLFEIESFSTQTTTPYPVYRRRSDSLDSEVSVINARRFRQSLDAQTECYEPSEASIDWSVTTAPAEGFDRASATNFSVSASEIEDAAEKGGGGGGERKKGNGLLLLSCRQEKAVSVGPNPAKCERDVGPASTAVGPAGGAKKPPLARAHSAHLSLSFAA